MVVIVWNVFIDHLHHKRHFFAIIIEFHVVKFQIKHIPHSWIYRFISYSIFGFFLTDPRRPSVWLETGLASESHYLISYFFVVLLEMLHPGKFLCVPPRFGSEPWNDVWTPFLALSRGWDMLFVDFAHEVIFYSVERTICFSEVNFDKFSQCSFLQSG